MLLMLLDIMRSFYGTLSLIIYDNNYLQMQSRFIFNGKTLWATETGEYESFSVLKPKVYPSDILNRVLTQPLTQSLP